MPFKSKAQQRYLESSFSPLTEGQKREYEGATDFSKLPERSKMKGIARKAAARVRSVNKGKK